MTDNDTITRTEMTAVEREYAVCPHCEMDYDPDEMVQIHANPKIRLRRSHDLVWLHRSDERETVFENLSVTSEDETLLCPACAENIGLESASAEGRDFDEIDRSWALPLSPEFFLIILIAVTMAVFFTMMVGVVIP